MTRQLVVNADDFGMHPMVDRGVVIGHGRGVVTSASLMVRGRSAEGAVAEARRLPRLSVGLHLDLGEWTHSEAGWRPAYEVVDLEDADAVARDVDRQLARFAELRGGPPTHIDSHQHVHLGAVVGEVVAERAAALGVPVRARTPGVHHVGGFYGQSGTGEPFPEGISLERLAELIRGLPEGTAELSCHPAAGPTVPPYSAERVEELRVLCHPRVRAVLRQEGVDLVGFHELGGGEGVR